MTRAAALLRLMSKTIPRLALAAVVMAAFAALGPHAGLAQQFEDLPPANPPPAQAAPPPRPPQRAPAAEVGGGGGGGGDGSLRQRIEQLEQQLVDMQVTMGTLESLARSGGAAPAARSGGVSSSEAARIDGLETQIRALTTQVEQLAAEVRGLGGQPRRAEALPPEGRLAPQAGSLADPPGAPPPLEKFGSTTVTPERGDPIGGLLSGDPTNKESPSTRRNEAPPQATADAYAPPVNLADAASNPKKLYETAYGYLLQQNYKAAETAFDEFLKRYPNDSLSGNAQYWLGESYFVRGEYKAAASAFLKGYETYAASTKAPDSLLKLAMSLDRLGQKNAACSSYAELAQKFPDAAPNVKSRAQTERQRVGCP